MVIAPYVSWRSSRSLLTDDFTVERTRFSTGDAIVCSFGGQPFTHRGQVIEPGGYLIVGRD
jgi:hypothetical protein